MIKMLEVLDKISSVPYLGWLTLICLFIFGGAYAIVIYFRDKRKLNELRETEPLFGEIVYTTPSERKEALRKCPSIFSPLYWITTFFLGVLILSVAHTVGRLKFLGKETMAWALFYALGVYIAANVGGFLTLTFNIFRKIAGLLRKQQEQIQTLTNRITQLEETKKSKLE